MEKTLELLLEAWNSIKSGSLTLELTQNSKIAKVSIDTKNFQLDIIEPKALLLQALKNFITTLVTTKFAIPKYEEFEELSFKEKTRKLKIFLKALEPYAQKLAKENRNFILKYKGKNILVLGSEAKAPLLKILEIEKIAVPHKLAFLKFIKEMKG